MKKSLGSSSLIFPSPVWCIGSYDANDRLNVMTAAWASICCSRPSSVAIALRKATYTYSSLLATRAYTVNVPSKKYASEADYFGMVSGKTVDKFKATGLTAEKAQYVHAPYVKEFPMVLECRVTHTLEIGLHTQFIGEILDVKVDESILGPDGLPDMQMVDPFLYSAETRRYYSIGDYMGRAYNIGKGI